jgi:hypothetical protein
MRVTRACTDVAVSPAKIAATAHSRQPALRNLNSPMDVSSH